MYGEVPRGALRDPGLIAYIPTGWLWDSLLPAVLRSALREYEQRAARQYPRGRGISGNCRAGGDHRGVAGGQLFHGVETVPVAVTFECIFGPQLASKGIGG